MDERDLTHPSMRRWVLIEPGMYKDTICPDLLHSSVFRAAFISPSEERLTPLVSAYSLKLWVMCLWTEPELVALYVHYAVMRLRHADTRQILPRPVLGWYDSAEEGAWR